MYPIQIKDRVIIITDYATHGPHENNTNIKNGMKGRVIDITRRLTGGELSFLVEFDVRIVSGHDGNMWRENKIIKGRDGHCWWVEGKCLKKTDPFEIGDIVKVTKSDNNGVIKEGDQGLVIGVLNPGSVCIEFFKHIDGHDGSGVVDMKPVGKRGYCWYVSPFNLEQVFDRNGETKMKSYTYKRGDRVVMKHNDENAKIGMKGTVFGIESSGLVGIEFDNKMGGHNGNGCIEEMTQKGLYGKQGHCWYVQHGRIELLEEDAFYMIKSEVSDTTNIKYWTFEDAKEEAEKLAKLNTTIKIYILKAVETVVVNGPEYKKLKPITGRKLIEVGACEDEALEFINLFGLDTDIELTEENMRIIEEHEAWIPFAINNGFIRRIK